MKYSNDPLYMQFAGMPSGAMKPLGGGPSSGSVVIPKSQQAVDARTLGYPDPRYTLDMHHSRREDDAHVPYRGPGEKPHREEA
jgi:hypothetical protein